MTIHFIFVFVFYKFYYWVFFSVCSRKFTPDIYYVSSSQANEQCSLINMFGIYSEEIITINVKYSIAIRYYTFVYVDRNRYKCLMFILVKQTVYMVGNNLFIFKLSRSHHNHFNFTINVRYLNQTVEHVNDKILRCFKTNEKNVLCHFVKSNKSWDLVKSNIAKKWFYKFFEQWSI